MASKTHVETIIPETEAGFLEWVRELAGWTGWRCYHTHDSRHSAKGWPDVILLRDGRLIAAEVKTVEGTVSPEQRDWLEALGRVPGCEAWVWRPCDRALIERLLL